MGDLSYNIKKYFKFDASEIRAMIIGVVVLGFIISFDEWGIGKEVDLYFGLNNLFNAILIMLLAMLVHVSAQRIAALSVGFRAQYKIWTYGIIIGVILAFFSAGKLWFLAAGGVIVHHMAGHRLGYFRYGLNYWPLGIVGIAGPIANLFLAIIFKMLLLSFPENILLQQAMVVNIWFALFNMLPIPPLDGSHMFFASRTFYVFAFAAMAGLGLSIYFLGPFISLFLGLLFGILAVSINAFISGRK